jgi:nitroimidazol reductase NimA-like FMN-containing flavoprotein (pyridoxamine 5'-phosphate oxidase superfamily)
MVTNKSITDFLFKVHVAILSIGRKDNSPHSTPVWYQYESDYTVWFLASKGTQKSKLLEIGKAVSLVAQTESDPYQYASIEGHITNIAEGDMEKDLRPIAKRYLGEKGGDEFVASFEEWNSSRYTVAIDKIMTMGISDD